MTLVLNGAKMCVTMSSNAMMADIIDYELDRSGKFIPAAVTGTYSSIVQVSILVFCSDCNRSGGIDRLQAHDATADRPVHTGNLLDDDEHGISDSRRLAGYVRSAQCARRRSPKEKMEEVQKSIQEKKQAEVEKVIEEMKKEREEREGKRNR